MVRTALFVAVLSVGLALYPVPVTWAGWQQDEVCQGGCGGGCGPCAGSAPSAPSIGGGGLTSEQQMGAELGTFAAGMILQGLQQTNQEEAARKAAAAAQAAEAERTRALEVQRQAELRRQQEEAFQHSKGELLDSLQGPDGGDNVANHGSSNAIAVSAGSGYNFHQSPHFATSQPSQAPRLTDQMLGPDDSAALPAQRDQGANLANQMMGPDDTPTVNQIGMTQGTSIGGAGVTPGTQGNGGPHGNFSKGDIVPDLNGSDEAVSAAAQKPFDSAGAAPAVSIQTSQTGLTGTDVVGKQVVSLKLGVSSPTVGPGGPVASAAEPIVPEKKPSQINICQDMKQLHERVKGFQEALARLDRSAELDQANREEWTGVTEKALEDFKRQLWKSVISVGFDFVDDSLTDHIDVAAGKVNKNLNALLADEDDPTLTQLKKIYRLRQKEAKITQIIEQDRWWVNKLKSINSAEDVADLAGKPAWEKTTEGAAVALDATLDNKYVKESLGATYGKTFQWSKTALDVSYDLLAKQYSYQLIEQANKNSDDYLRAVKTLNHKMQTTIDQIKNLEQMDGSPSSACQRASNE